MSGSRVNHRASQTVRYREQLWVPWWWWPLGFVGNGLMAYEVRLGLRSLPGWLPFAVFFAITVAALLWLGRIQVRVVETDGEVELWVGEAHLPARRDRPFRGGSAVGQVGGAGPPTRSGGLRRASRLGGTHGADRARRSRRPDAVLAGQLPSSAARVGSLAGLRDGTGQAAQSVQIITPFFSLASRLRC